MPTNQIRLPAKVAQVLGPARGSVDYRGLHGGRGSGKSMGAAKVAATWAMQDRIRVLCAREFQASIKESFHAELKAAIESEPWMVPFFDLGADYLRCTLTGSEFLFRGLRHNSQSIKSLSKIDLTIVEEAEDVPEMSWLALEATVFRQPQSELWAIWNPRKRASPVDKRLRMSPPARSIVQEVNYNDNPFFPPGMETLRARQQQMLDPMTYAHIWDGAYLENSNTQVLGDKCATREFEPQRDWDGPYFGGDFGFSQDPTFAVEVWVFDGRIWIRREAHRIGLELDDTASFVLDRIPGFDREVSRWDSARPESISFLKRHGLPRIEGVQKGKGSVEDGIQFLRSFKEIVIHPDCTEMQKEARLYSYKLDRLTGDVTSTIVDAHNHGWDAVRYAIAPMIKRRADPKIRAL